MNQSNASTWADSPVHEQIREAGLDPVSQSTPETESWCGWGIGGLQVVPASFARKLKRERDEAREQRDMLAEALRKIAHCDWVITLPNRMDAVRAIAQKALQSLTPNTQGEAQPPATKL